MYYCNMERKKLKQILFNYTDSTSTVISWMNGTRRPTYEILCELDQKHKIPFTAWQDIKSFITDTITEDEKDKKVNKEENLTKELQSA